MNEKIGLTITLLKFQGMLRLEIDVGKGKPLSFKEQKGKNEAMSLWDYFSPFC